MQKRLEQIKKPDDIRSITEPKTNILGGNYTMLIKKVEVEFLFEGIIKQSENMQGVLFGNKVFLNDTECGPGLYNAVITDNADRVLVNLDNDGTDYLSGKADLLIDLIIAA